MAADKRAPRGFTIGDGFRLGLGFALASAFVGLLGMGLWALVIGAWWAAAAAPASR